MLRLRGISTTALLRLLAAAGQPMAVARVRAARRATAVALAAQQMVRVPQQAQSRNCDSSISRSAQPMLKTKKCVLPRKRLGFRRSRCKGRVVARQFPGSKRRLPILGPLKCSQLRRNGLMVRSLKMRKAKKVFQSIVTMVISRTGLPTPSLMTR